MQKHTKVKNMEDTIVLYPAPGSGHLISMVELGKLILSRGHFSTIHILVIAGFNDAPATAAYLRNISETYSSIILHRFPTVLNVNTSPAVSFLANMFGFIRLNTVNVHQTLQEISRTFKVHALVIDFFCASAVPVSENLGIPVFFFFTSGLAALAAYLHFPTIHNQVDKSFKDLYDTKFQIPGLPMLPAKHMPQPVLNRDEPVYYDIMYYSHCLSQSSGIIVNSFNQLEPIAMKAVIDGLCVPDGRTPPIYNIGPLIADSYSKFNNHGDHNLQHSCLSWLDTQPSRSVVFLCFGSMGTFSGDQVKEIAKGLERSGHRFLWVVRKPRLHEKIKEFGEVGEFNVMTIMPEGFLDSTKGRGMVVESWAPQVAVLEHPAVGGFVTHCGWNSILEAVMAGVPMVAWPLYAEQHLNKAAVVAGMKMAIAVEQRGEDGFVVGEEVEKRVRELMDHSETSVELRERSHEMKLTAIDSLGDMGSSTAALDKLVRVWLGN
ncbi:UDP-glycosyltransferase 88F4 [Primulina huaijiensis]|uniref:UDP-glycosyltransferase 88F4 n=1 Tax=Primulina huaijiensis TaxID=1492673 RepID=UPI003CC72D9C